MSARREADRRRFRPTRGRERTRGKSETDAIAVALTAQIIICVLILLLAGGVRRASAEHFAVIKGEYLILVGTSEGAVLSDYFASLSGMPGGFFTYVENIIQNLMGRTPPPQDGSENLYSQAEDEPTATGGGYSPVFYESRRDMLPAPAGTSLAPFALAGRMRPPLAGIITSPFAFRVHPISGGVDFHRGIDIAAPHGHAILAALPGQVERVGESDIYGKYVLLRHTPDLATFYAHCSYIFVREGMNIRRGERIATVGDTGMSTGPHLHFAVIAHGLYVDPLFALERYIQPVE